MSPWCLGMALPPGPALGLTRFPVVLTAACPLPKGLGGWPGMACAPRRARWNSPSGPGGGSSGSPFSTPHLACPGVRGLSSAPASPRQRRGPLALGQGGHQSTVGEFQAQHSREGAGAGGAGVRPCPLPLCPHPCCAALGVMLAGARGGAVCRLGAVPALAGVQPCLQPPPWLPPLGWGCVGRPSPSAWV